MRPQSLGCRQAGTADDVNYTETQDFWARFGTEGSKVQILSPRPIIFKRPVIVDRPFRFFSSRPRPSCAVCPGRERSCGDP